MGLTAKLACGGKSAARVVIVNRLWRSVFVLFIVAGILCLLCGGGYWGLSS
jgi:hypothetical protein